MKTEGVSFRHAVKLLREDNASLVTAAMIVPAGPRTRLTREGLGVKRSRVQKLETPLERTAEAAGFRSSFEPERSEFIMLKPRESHKLKTEITLRLYDGTKDTEDVLHPN